MHAASRLALYCAALSLISVTPARADEIAPVAVPSSAAVSSGASNPIGAIEQHTLPNGLRVVLSPQTNTARVAVDVVYHCGFRDQPAGYNGLPHIVEHSMFEGSLHVGPHQYFAQLERAGADYVNALTQIDRTEYLEQLPAEQLPLALWLESDRMAYLLDVLNESRLAGVRRTVQNEYLSTVATIPAANANRFLYATLFPEGHPYHSILDDDSDLGAIGLSDVQWFFQQYYSPANATLVISGNFDPAAALALIERYFATIRASSAATPRTPPSALPIPTAERHIDLDVPLRRGPILIGWVTPQYLSNDDAVLDILADLLVSAPRLGMRERLVEQGAIAESVSARQHSMDYASVFSVRVLPRPGAYITTVLPLIDRVIEAVRTTPFDSADIARARSRITLDLRQAWQDPFERARMMAHYDALNGNPDGLARDVARYATIDAASVLGAARVFLAPARRVVETIYTAPRAPLQGRLASSGSPAGGSL